MITKVRRPWKYTQEQIDSIIKMLHENTPSLVISRELGIPVKTIYYYKEKQGV